MTLSYLCKVKQGIYLIVILLLFKPVLPVVDYFVNYDYFANVLCENKAKPALKCNGKCQLMKQLAKVSEAEKQDSKDKKTNVKIEWEIPFILLPIDSFISYHESSMRRLSIVYTNLYIFCVDQSVFHPPTV